MSDPLISIVLPVYNGARYLPQALEGCLQQDFGDWELIIVDDASTDQTPEIAAECACRDPRVRVLRNPTNRRLPASLNRGFAWARGRLLTWTSDDNRYRPDALASMHRFLDRHPQVDLVYAGYTCIDEEGRPGRTVMPPPPRRLAFDNGVGPCFLYRRRVHEELGGYAEDLFTAEDYDFWLRAAARFRLAPLPKDLYLYRHHGASLSSTHSETVRRTSDRALRRNLPRLHWLGPQTTARAYLRLARREAARWRPLSFCACCLQALRHAPLLTLRNSARSTLRAMGVRRGRPRADMAPGEGSHTGAPDQ